MLIIAASGCSRLCRTLDSLFQSIIRTPYLDVCNRLQFEACYYLSPDSSDEFSGKKQYNPVCSADHQCDDCFFRAVYRHRLFLYAGQPVCTWTYRLFCICHKRILPYCIADMYLPAVLRSQYFRNVHLCCHHGNDDHFHHTGIRCQI